MHILSVPISIIPMTDENRYVYLEQIRKVGAKRVFLLGELDPVFEESSLIYTDPERLQETIRFFQNADLEVGVWVSAFGHGVVLAGMAASKNADKLTPLTGVMGDTVSEAYCPLDPHFAAAYRESIVRIARMKPDIIMLDDDFRLNTRSYYMGCFCPLHLQEYYRRIGEEIPREQLEEKIFTGGKNKYRTAYMQMQHDTLLDFAHMLRNVVDEVAPQTRMGVCSIKENWDYTGTDAIEIAKAFAGSTKPFLRTHGAPYSVRPLHTVVEDNRQQIYWSEKENVEAFTEGDVYPRPRYAVSSARLELFDLILLADGHGDGILKYMFDYTFRPDYEIGYIERHIRNASLREAVQDLFSNKQPIGVYAFNVMHKIENWQLPDTPPHNIVNRLIDSYQSTAGSLLAGNGIPSAYTKQDWPMLIMGENARYVTVDDLKNGAFLDVPAAKILAERGIDTGLLSEEDMALCGEYFEEQQDTARAFGTVAAKKITCTETAKVWSRFVSTDSPACYTYENSDGLRFGVLACDWYMCDENKHFFENYYRQVQLINVLEWVGRKKLPAVCTKNPKLYLLASSDGKAMSVALANIFDDDILNPTVYLDKPYDHIRFVNCSGTLDGDIVHLDTLPPFGFAAFEVF